MNPIAALAAFASFALTAPVFAQTTTITGSGGNWNNDTWNQLSGGLPDLWDNGIPSGAGPWDVVITGSRVYVTSGYLGAGESPTPAFTGNVTLQANAELEFGANSTDGDLAALGTGTITLNAGSGIFFRRSANTVHNQDIVMAGDAQIDPCLSTNAHVRSRTWNGTISGPGKLTTRGESRNTMIFTGNNSTWSGGLLAYHASLNLTQGSMVTGAGAGCFGTGDVTIDLSQSLKIDVANAIDDNATLYLTGWKGSDAGAATTKLVMNAADTVGALVLDGYPYPGNPTTYGAPGSGADIELASISGGSLLTVNSGADPGSLTATFDATGEGGSTTNVYVGEPVIYTVTFSGPTDVELTSADVENSTGTGMTIESVTPVDNPVAGPTSYTVVVKATEAGTLNLRIKSGVVINDLFGNALAVPVADNDTFTVDPLPAFEGELGVWKPWSNNRINPATGLAWAEGDEYRLAFVTSTNGVRDCSTTDITAYNAFVQSVAASSTTYPDLGNGTWNVMGATDTVDGKTNTGTGGAGGGAVLLMDGVQVFANNNADIWGNTELRVPGIYYAPYLDENGNEQLNKKVFFGANTNGTARDRHLGGSDESPPRVETGITTPNNGSRWAVQSNSFASDTNTLFYGLSEPLTLQAVGGSDPFADWSVLDGATGVTFDGDENGDGVQDGLAFLLGAANPNVDANGNLPTVTEDGSGGLVLTFSMLKAADRGSETMKVEWSSDLGVSDLWSGNQALVPETTPVPQVAPVDFIIDGSGALNAVTATISSSEAVGGKLFGRLLAESP